MICKARKEHERDEKRDTKSEWIQSTISIESPYYSRYERLSVSMYTLWVSKLRALDRYPKLLPPKS